MKAENTDEAPAFNLLKHDGVGPQAHAKEITKVLLNDNNWYDIVPGSFKFFKTAGDKAVPYVRFQALLTCDRSTDQDKRNGNRFIKLEEHTIEVWPATVAGWAYPNEGETDGAPSEAPPQRFD